jgi:hypothetical protein
VTTWRKDAPIVALSRFADTVGDGTGTSIAVGNYSDVGLGVTDFMIAPAAGEVFQIERMIVSIEDTVGMDADSYGNGITLTNGIDVLVANDTGDLWYWTQPNHPITTNGEWAHYCYDAQLLGWGQGNEHIVVRWTFGKTGHPLVLNGNVGAKLIIRLNDDFSGLIDHGFLIQGVKREGF